MKVTSVPRTQYRHYRISKALFWSNDSLTRLRIRMLCLTVYRERPGSSCYGVLGWGSPTDTKVGVLYKSTYLPQKLMSPAPRHLAKCCEWKSQLS